MKGYAVMEMPKPTDAHKKLERLVGRWSGEEKMFPSPWDPKGGMAVARVNNKLALDGFAVVQHYEQERGGTVTFRGHGVFRWDPNQNTYMLYWFDSMGFPPNEFRGDFKDNILMMAYQGPQGHTRATFDLSQDRRYTFRMEVSQDGKQWVPFTEGLYTRQD
jgi:hypothetical protein